MLELIFGVASWVLGFFAINKACNGKNILNFVFLSLASAMISVTFVVFYLNSEVIEGDWSALMDVTGGLLVCSVILVIGSVLINVIALFLNDRNQAKN